MDQRKKIQKSVFVTVVGAAVNILLSVLKIWIGWSFAVQSVLADGFHSLSDLASDTILIVFVQLSGKPRSRRRPYGYRKWETLATVMVAVMLFIVAVVMFLGALLRRDYTDRTFGLIPFIIIIVSIVAKESLYWYTIFEGKRIRSPALMANAWHHRSDAFSSVAVLFCMIMAFFFGRAWLWDLLGVAMVSVMIVKAAWDIAGGAFSDLLDYAPDTRILDKIEQVADTDPEVRLVRDVRARTISGYCDVSFCVEVDGHLTVSQGHAVTERIERAILANLPEVLRVIVHVEPAGTLAARISRNGIENIPDEELL